MRTPEEAIERIEHMKKYSRMFAMSKEGFAMQLAVYIDIYLPKHRAMEVLGATLKDRGGNSSIAEWKEDLTEEFAVQSCDLVLDLLKKEYAA